MTGTLPTHPPSKIPSPALDFPPRISGRSLKALATLAKTRAGASLLLSFSHRDLRIGEVGTIPSSMLGEVPIDTRPVAGRPPREGPSAGLPLPAAPWSGTSATLVERYRSGATSPARVVDRAYAEAQALAARAPACGPILDAREDAARAEAAASAERWRTGAALGPLDGVPVLVKEQTSVAGLPARAGSDLSDATPATRDATCVARLRAAGAIVLGTAMMTEYGMSPLGFNPKRAMPRNPHATGHVAGGSSTGTGVAVATGVVPLAVGADGGGSIRIPAALCGVFGMKPTWGRVSRSGDVLAGSVGHLGPIASSTLDLAHFLETASGPDPHDAQTDLAPVRAPGSFVAALGRGVRGSRIGVVASEWADASGDVAKAGHAALEAIAREGATLVDVRLDLARYAAPVGYVTISIEALASLYDLFESGAVFNADLAILFGSIARLSATEVAYAQRVRTGLRLAVAALLRDVDVLALPTTATTAPPVTEAEFEGGFLDTRALDAMCRFNFLGNLTGLPALSAPVGADASGLPIGLQIVGDAWDEATVLALGAHLERTGVARVLRPPVARAASSEA
jgi:aspartyl-tRNA(Asn)/glutamyl-tRNA(Gln) amidotransferase subunit A